LPRSYEKPPQDGVSLFVSSDSVARFANRLQTYVSRTSAAIRLAAVSCMSGSESV